MNIRKIFVVLLCLVINACTQERAKIDFKGEQPYDESYKQIIGNTIFVEPGDNVYSIASKYNVSFMDLVTFNNLQWPYELYPGQRLQLPESKIYEVQLNDDVNSIAHKFNLTAADIISINNLLPPYQLKAGQVIKIGKSSVNQETTLDKHFNDSLVIPEAKKLIVDQELPKPQNNTKGKIKIINAQIKFVWPIQGKIISSFGPQVGGIRNDGINIAASEGSPVKAAYKGQIIYTGNELVRFGNLVIIKHDHEWFSAYAHLKNILYKKGDIIKTGQIIGYVGKTGNINTPQLHFALRNGKTPVNPISFLPKKVKR